MANNIYIDTSKTKNIYVDTSKVKKIYRDTDMIWQSAIPIARPTSAQLNPSATYTSGTISNGFSMTGVEYVSGDTSGINASTYVAYYQPDEEHIWEDTEDRAQVAVTLTINAKSISGATVSVSSNPTYNGSSQSVTVNSVTIDGLSATFTVSGNSGTNAGSYTLTCAGNGNFTGTQTAGWGIGQATITGFSLNTTSRTYNGSSQSVSVSSVTAGSLSATYTTGGTYSATNAGSYTAYVYGSGNFTGTLSCGWAMNQKSISGGTVTLSTTSTTYNASSQSTSISSVTISGLSATYSTSGTTSATNAGTYTVTATGTGNFTGTASATWKINARALTGLTLNTTSRTYNGSSQSVSVSSVTANGITCGTYTTSGTYSATSAGTYTAYVTGTGNFTGSASASWTMNRATIDTFTLNTTSRTYNGSSQSVSVSTCKGNGVNATYSTSGTWSATSAGSYTATVTGTGNFQGSKSVSWTMNRLTITSFSLNTTSRTYNGSSQSVSVSSVTAGSLSATYSTSGTYSATNAGSYTAYVTGTGNFQGTLSCGWTMATRALDTFTLSGSGAWYTGGTKSVSAATVSGGGLSATYSTSGTWSAVNGGYYTAYVTGTGNFSGTLSCQWYIQYVWYKYYSVYSATDVKTTVSNVARGGYYYLDYDSSTFKGKYVGRKGTGYTFNTSTGKFALSSGSITLIPTSLSSYWTIANCNGSSYRFGAGLPKSDNSNSWDKIYEGSPSTVYGATSWEITPYYTRAYNESEDYLGTAYYHTASGSYSRGSYLTSVTSTSSSSAYPSNGRSSSDGYWYVQQW